MKRNLALLAMLLLPFSSFAQYSLIGQVTDETGTSIQGAQLCLYQDGELAGLAQSNAKGEYRIGDVPQGSYQVVASCVGYSSDEDSVVIDRDANLNFILMTKSVELDSVVVMGSSSRATSKGHVFYLTKKAKECGNPFVALQEIPLLYSDPVNESVRSADGQSMLILVDGMRVNSGVSPIDPARIKSVEIIDVVSAKYMRQGVKRVVNIKLKDTSLYTYAQLSTRATIPPNPILPCRPLRLATVPSRSTATPLSARSTVGKKTPIALSRPDSPSTMQARDEAKALITTSR